MSCNGLMYSIVLLCALSLTRCASTSQVNHLSIEVRDLHERIDQVNESINNLHADLEQAKSEATRANKRLDNQVSFYRK